MPPARSTIASVALLGALVALAVTLVSPREHRHPRGIVMIVVDSLRADHVGTYGYPRDTTPHLDALAAESVVFERAYSQSSWTTPSFASIFTSLYPSVHRVGHAKTRFGYTWSLAESPPTLATSLSDAGFATAALVDIPTLSKRRGLGRGFDSYVNLEEIAKDGAVTRRTDPDAVAVLRELAGRNFLFVWHILDPHWPYHPPPEHDRFGPPDYEGSFENGLDRTGVSELVEGRLPLSTADRKRLVALYDAEVRYADEQIGSLVDALDAIGLADAVMLIVTSDHGESLLEHGHYGHSLPMYEETLRVPLIVRRPGVVPRRVPNVVQLIDLMPTLLDEMDVEAPDGLQGQSLSALLRGEAGWVERPAFSEAPQFVERKSLRTGTHRLIFNADVQILDDQHVPGDRSTRYLRFGSPKLYAASPAVGSMRRVIRPDTEMMRTLGGEIRARILANQARQITDQSAYYSFHAHAAWRDTAENVRGRPEITEAGLELAGADSSVEWLLEFPQPLRRFEIHLRASCTDKIPFFEVASDTGPKLTARASADPIGRPLRHAMREAFDGARSVRLRYFGSDTAECTLTSFRTLASFTADATGPDALDLQQLRALGYSE